MRRIACAMAVALTTALIGSFGCHNDQGDDGPDGGTGPCNPAVSISVSTASGGFEVYCGGELVGSSDRSATINNALCGNRPGSFLRVVVHDRATLISRTVSGAYPLMFDWDGDGDTLPALHTSVFTTQGAGSVTTTVPQ